MNRRFLFVTWQLCHAVQGITSLTGFTSMLYHLQVSLNLQNHTKTNIKHIKVNKANIKYKNTRS